MLKKLIIIIVLVAITSCNNNKTYLIAQVDGNDFINTTQVFAKRVKVGNKIYLTSIIAQGKDINDEIGLSINEFPKNKVEPILTHSLLYNLKNKSWLEIIYKPKKRNTKASFKITKEDKNYIEGTFNFIGYNKKDKSTKKITNGEFRAKKIN